MNIKEESPVDVPGAHLAKMCLIPAHPDWLHHLNSYKRIKMGKMFVNGFLAYKLAIVRLTCKQDYIL